MEDEVPNGLGDSLKEITDLERILSRLEVGSANARDMAALRAALRELPQIKNGWEPTRRPLRVLNRRIALHSDILDVLERGIVDEPPFSLRDGGMIRTGFNAELDELTTLRKTTMPGCRISSRKSRKKPASGH